MAWPTTATVEAWVQRVLPDLSAGEVTALCAGYADAAKAEFEKMTGWRPFESTGTLSARYFDPPGEQTNSGHPYGAWMGSGRVMILENGIIEAAGVIVTTGVTAADDTGAVQTVNVDYSLFPYNAAAEGIPFTEIHFRSPRQGSPRSIKITAKWGYCAALPSDVTAGVIAGAGAMALGDYLLSLGLNSNLSDWKEADAAESVNAGLAKAAFDNRASGMARFEKTIRRYSRLHS
jgi:hypothetical protein